MIGLLFAAGLFYWLYIRPLERREILSIKDDRVGRSIVQNRDKVLVIGVSGMTWDMALELINDGRMPNLARMLRKGSHGNIRAEPPFISPALWTDYVTGRSREDHGITNYSAKLPFSYHQVRMSNRFRRVPAIWDMAEFAGRSVGLVNWSTVTDAPELKDSVVIAEGFNPDSNGQRVHPDGWKKKALSAPVPRFLPYENLIREIGDKRIKNAYEADRKVFSMAFELMERKSPDLMMVRFRNSEVISQIFYKYARSYSMDHYEPVNEEQKRKYEGVVDMHYEFIDRLIGGLLSLSKGYTVIVVSEHGLGPAYPPHNIFPKLNALLERMGYLDYYGTTCKDILTRMVERGELEVSAHRSARMFAMCQKLESETEKWIEKGAQKMEPAALEAFMSVNYGLADPSAGKRERRQKEMVLLSDSLVPGRRRQNVSWDRTKAWNIRDFEKPEQGLYINLEQREPQGTVPKENFHSFRKKLIKELKRLRTENGMSLFQSVRENPRKEINPMTKADTPDILVKIDRNALLHHYALQRANDPDPIPLAALRTVYSDVSALPTKSALIAISGENAKTFRHLNMESMDLAPTVLWLLGIPVGADMPGKVKKEAFEEDLHDREVLYIDSWEKVIEKR